MPREERPTPDRGLDAAGDDPEVAVEAARRTAEAVLEDAQRRADRIIAEAERERAHLHLDLARQHAVVEETRRKLAAVLLDILEEVERTPGELRSNVHDLSEARTSKSAAAGADQ